MSTSQQELGLLRGRVTLLETRAPLGDSTIQVLFGSDATPDILPTTDDAGWFQMGPLAPGLWVIRVVGPHGEAGLAEASVLPGEITTIEIAVTSVMESDREPVEPDVKGFEPEEPDMSRFDPEERRLITEEIPGDPPDDSEVEPSYGTDRSTETVRGRVIWADTGEGVPDAVILVVDGPAPVPDIAPLTDSQGGFQLHGLTDGSWHLRAMTSGGDRGDSFTKLPLSSTLEIAIERPRPAT